jgi:hypothetical protein
MPKQDDIAPGGRFLQIRVKFYQDPPGNSRRKYEKE